MNTPHQVLSVNVAQASPLMIDGRRVMTAIGKRPVSTPAQPDRIAVRPLGLGLHRAPADAVLPLVPHAHPLLLGA